MSKVIEIITFPCSEAFSNDQATVLGPALEASMTSPGCLQVYYGLQVEQQDHKQVGCFTAIWETYEAHKNLLALPNHNEAVQKAFSPAVAGPSEGRHVQNLTGELDAAVSAPVTEIATFKLREGGSMDKLRESIAELRKGPSTGCLGIISGDCVEHPDTYIAMLGWDSVEAHTAATKASGFEGIVRSLLIQADIDVKHYSYAKYPA